MAMSSVSSVSNAVPQQQVQPSQRQSDREQVQRSADEATKTREAPPPQRVEQVERTPENNESPRPVVNAQGQKTGTIINTTA